MQPAYPQALIITAQALVGLEAQPGMPETLLVQQMRRRSNLARGAPWDLAFVHHAGWWSQRLRGAPSSTWPCDPTNSHEQLAVWAHAQGAKYEQGEDDVDLSAWDVRLVSRNGAWTVASARISRY